jgi:hypothetical protein
MLSGISKIYSAPLSVLFAVLIAYREDHTKVTAQFKINQSDSKISASLHGKGKFLCGMKELENALIATSFQQYLHVIALYLMPNFIMSSQTLKSFSSIITTFYFTSVAIDRTMCLLVAT